MPALSSASAKAGAVSSDKEENPELIKFRAEWFAELQKRKAASTSSKNAVPSSSTSHHAEGSSAGASQSPPGPGFASYLSEKTAVSTSFAKEPIPSRAVLTVHPAVNNGEITSQSHRSTTLERALDVYRRAVEHEQRSELDEALLLYRRAFRLDDNVDRAFRREEMLKSILKEQQALNTIKPLDELEELAATFKASTNIQPTISTKATYNSVTGTLASLVQGFLDTDLKFEPENENEPVILNLLPEELLVVVLGNLDPTSIERFARVSKKARVLTLDPGIWRKLVRQTYQPPQITDYETIIPVIEGFFWNFRRFFIEHPRLRLDGIYIATCHYVRPGLSENSWVNTSHLITYHRYLRFYPNGQVLSLLANEEHTPQQIIPIFKPTLRMNGLFFGQWKLIGTTVHLTNLIDASGRFALPVSAATGPTPPPEPYSSSSCGSVSGEHARYAFLMTLNLRSRPLGRWNRMDIQAYESLNIETGDINPIVLKHERPFWFSKVRSYAHT